MYPTDLKYTPEHEWLRAAAEQGVLRVGVTHYAQESLGDLVYVSLPEVGTRAESGEPLGEIESTKSVSDVYAPVSGTVTARNDALDEQPDLVNSDPYGEGWMVEIGVDDPSGVHDVLDGLMDASAYQEMVEKE
ncbi:MAG: glycine cleavage system protein GcvH [Streptosporangiaceae bacterium]